MGLFFKGHFIEPNHPFLGCELFSRRIVTSQSPAPETKRLGDILSRQPWWDDERLAEIQQHSPLKPETLGCPKPEAFPTGEEVTCSISRRQLECQTSSPLWKLTLRAVLFFGPIMIFYQPPNCWNQVFRATHFPWEGKFTVTSFCNSIRWSSYYSPKMIQF